MLIKESDLFQESLIEHFLVIVQWHIALVTLPEHTHTHLGTNSPCAEELDIIVQFNI
jgi:hypothetical protein